MLIIPPNILHDQNLIIIMDGHDEQISNNYMDLYKVMSAKTKEVPQLANLN